MLDHANWQRRLIDTTKREGYRLVILDPLRALTNCVDQGPAELQPFANFVRSFIHETECVLALVHHDTKPKQGFFEDRMRGQRASGGGILAIAESPVHVQRIKEATSQLVPNAWKISAAPPP